MTLPNDAALQKIQFYVTAPYSCGYIHGRLAQSLIAAPHHLIDARTYSGLIQLGFRRSGKFAYRPHCENCSACIPVRIPVAEFTASRNQRRAEKQHRNLSATIMPVGYSEEHFKLYQAYQLARHSEDNAEQDTVEQYRNFLVQSNVETMLVEFRLDGMLKMVSVVDIVTDGISAVYTFYDAADTNSSYGTYSILWLVNWALQLEKPYLYLGYWISESRKMAYKQNFAPLEALKDGEWRPIEDLHQK
ncbi:MAG: arginyltransferase [Betaproteobacteria bacterium HGW-Betaproteobacteria-2]|nr:MAG: arginyltransferase [Betaproteobacteria bacterium HGW-Betaproteobacteria-2]